MGNKGSTDSIVPLNDDDDDVEDEESINGNDDERFIPTPQPKISKTSLKFILNVLQKLPLAFDKDSAQKLLYQLEETIHSPDKAILTGRESAPGIFIVMKGKCNVIGSDKKSIIRELRPGNFFGEISCLYNVSSTCSVVTAEGSECTTVVLTNMIVKELIEDPGKQLVPIQSWFVKQGYLDVSCLFPDFDLPRAILKKIICQSPVFYGWSKEAISEVTDQLPNYVIEIHQPDTFLMYENDCINCVYLLLEGSVELLSKGSSLTYLHSHGSCISLGEECLFSSNSNSVFSIKVQHLSHCVSLHQEFLDIVLRNYPVECAKLIEWKKLWQEYFNVNSKHTKDDLALMHPNYIIDLLRNKGTVQLPTVYLYELSLRMDYFSAENDGQVFEVTSDYHLEPLVFVVLKGEMVITAPSSPNINVNLNEIFYLNPSLPIKTKVVTKEHSLIGALRKSLINELDLKYDLHSKMFL